MFGECHAHIIMDGVNYRHAVEVHKNGPDDKIIREHLKAYQERGIVLYVMAVMRWVFLRERKSLHQSME